MQKLPVVHCYSSHQNLLFSSKKEEKKRNWGNWKRDKQVLIQNMIYLVTHLQNEVSHHLLHCSCVVKHRGHKKRESESDLKFNGSHHQISPASPSAAKRFCNVSTFMLDVSFSSSISHLCVSHPVTPCNYVHPCNEREKYGNRHVQCSSLFGRDSP